MQSINSMFVIISNWLPSSTPNYRSLLMTCMLGRVYSIKHEHCESVSLKEECQDRCLIKWLAGSFQSCSNNETRIGAISNIAYLFIVFQNMQYYCEFITEIINLALRKSSFSIFCLMMKHNWKIIQTNLIVVDWQIWSFPLIGRVSGKLDCIKSLPAFHEEIWSWHCRADHDMKGLKQCLVLLDYTPRVIPMIWINL